MILDALSTLSHIRETFGNKLLETVESVETILDPANDLTFDEKLRGMVSPRSMNNRSPAGYKDKFETERREKVFKDLLIESQFQHLKAFKDCENLLKQREQEITQLRARLKKMRDVDRSNTCEPTANEAKGNKIPRDLEKLEDEEASSELLVSPLQSASLESDVMEELGSFEHSFSLSTSGDREDSESQSQNVATAETLRDSKSSKRRVKFEEHLRRTLQEKVDALAECRLYQETTHQLQQQLKILKDRIRDQHTDVTKLKKLNECLQKKAKSSRDMSRTSSGQQTGVTMELEKALEDLAQEYSLLSSEYEDAKRRFRQLRHQHDALTEGLHKKIKAQQTLIDSLLSTNPSSSPIKHVLSQSPLPSLPSSPMNRSKASSEVSLQNVLTSPASRKLRRYQQLLTRLEKSHDKEMQNLEEKFRELQPDEVTDKASAERSHLSVSAAVVEPKSPAIVVAETNPRDTADNTTTLNDKAQSPSEDATLALRSLETEKQMLKKQYETLSTDYGAVQTELEDVRLLVQASEEKLSALRLELRAKTEALDESEQLKENCEALLVGQQSLQVALDDKDKELSSLTNQLSDHATELAMQQKEAKRLKILYEKECKQRREIHNELSVLKGSIRVFCRVRPALQHELKPESSNTDLSVKTLSSFALAFQVSRKPLKQFEFDRVFSSESTQEEVFDQVAPLVTSVLDGYDVCLFAYGQTGSGKTYTMEGPDSDPGVNIRTLKRLFQCKAEQGHQLLVTINLSILEIYNETVIDLLVTERSTNDSTQTLELRQREEGTVFVQGLSQVEVLSLAHAQELLSCAQDGRRVGSHNLNERSSRSHLVVQVNVCTENVVTQLKTTATLSLIDLAGSERLSKTEATGDTLKEAQNINKSLSSLGDVIHALQQQSKKSHVPFRNSKLTFLLQNSLRSGGKVAMFVNLSPVLFNANETLCSLNFANRCAKVALGRASAHTTADEEISRYKAIAEDLKDQLASLQRQTRTSGAPLSPRLKMKQSASQRDLSSPGTSPRPFHRRKTIASFKP